MSIQTEQEKWKELGEILGLELLSAGPRKAIYQDHLIAVHIGCGDDFRDSILNAIHAAKARTPLELAAPMMAEELLRLMDIIGTEDYSLTEQVLKKAGVIK